MKRFIQKFFLSLLTVIIATPSQAAEAEYRYASEDVRQTPPLEIPSFPMIDTLNLEELEPQLEAAYPKLRQAEGRDITVILGNVGNGKSTFGNLLANIHMKIDETNSLILPADAENGFSVRASNDSQTRVPEALEAEDVGLIYDTPGFCAREGARLDVLGVALIKYLLEAARTVKAIFFTSASEISGGGRGAGFGELCRNMQLFAPEFLQESAMLVVNKMQPRFTNRIADWVRMRNIVVPEYVQRLVDEGRAIGLPEADYDKCESVWPGSNEGLRTFDSTTMQADIERFKKVHAELRAQNVRGRVDASATLSRTVSSDLQHFFRRHMRRTLRVHQDTWREMGETLLDDTPAKKEAAEDAFLQALTNQPLVKILKSIANTQYTTVQEHFMDRWFERSFDAVVTEARFTQLQRQQRQDIEALREELITRLEETHTRQQAFEESVNTTMAQQETNVTTRIDAIREELQRELVQQNDRLSRRYTELRQELTQKIEETQARAETIVQGLREKLDEKITETKKEAHEKLFALGRLVPYIFNKGDEIGPALLIRTLVHENDIPAFESCIQLGISLNEPFKYIYLEQYPLSIAVRQGKIEACKKLIALGAKVELEDDGLSALQIATQGKSYEICEFLLEQGADPLKKNKENKCALDYAAKSPKLLTLLQLHASKRK